ncbi:MAG: phage holin family protein [Bacteroidia bacterium]
MDLKEPVHHLAEYIETRLELFRLQLLDKLSSTFSTLASLAIVACFFLFFVIFSSVALALLLGKWLGDYYIGFAIISGFYLLLTIIFFIFKRQLIYNPILNKMVTVFFPENKDAENGKKADKDL